jgi:uncharacterized Zn finger protein
VLLERRRTEHPDQVLGHNQELIEDDVLDGRDKHRYRRAVALLPSLRAAYDAAGDRSGFETYLDDLRRRHARRPTFLDTLDRWQHNEPTDPGR